jgi:hypothetical protein
MTMTNSLRCATSSPDLQSCPLPASVAGVPLRVQLVPGGDEMARHGGAHDAQTDESDFAHVLMSCLLFELSNDPVIASQAKPSNARRSAALPRQPESAAQWMASSLRPSP